MDGFVSQAQQIILVEEGDGRENLYLGSVNGGKMATCFAYAVGF